MAEKKNYVVRRPHEGDRWYDEGEIRVLSETVAARLVGFGVLEEYRTKVQPLVMNKAFETAPQKKRRSRKTATDE